MKYVFLTHGTSYIDRHTCKEFAAVGSVSVNYDNPVYGHINPVRLQ
jgi:UDP-glucose 4-epimerase